MSAYPQANGEPATDPELFRSFWMAGYEGADHVNGAGTAIDMDVLTQHERQAHRDYERLREFGISTVRESIGWRLVERDGRFDFSPLQHRIQAARSCEIQILWTLCHFGWPSDADVFSDDWIGRFTRFCEAAARFLSDGNRSGFPAVFTPINEISFLTWAICESNLIHPYRGDRGMDALALKRRLVRAAIEGSEAIWNVDPDARLLTVDPVIHIVAPPGRPDLEEPARQQDESQFQAWDMLAGKAEPDLGGAPKYLGVLGINYYHNNQWEYETYERLHWHLRDPRRVPLRALMARVHGRYGHPFIIGETSHIGIGRGEWMLDIGDEVIAAFTSGLQLLDVCVSPIIDRPDWNDFSHWHNSGLWDLRPVNGHLERTLCEDYARALHRVQHAVSLQSRRR